MAQYKFNQAEYDKWLRANNLAGAKSPEDREFARRRYIEEVLIPTFGNDREVFKAAITEFVGKKPVAKEYLDEILPQTISPSSPANNQVTTPPTSNVGGIRALNTALDSSVGKEDEIIKRATGKRSIQSAVTDTEKAKEQTIAGGIAAGTGALKALTGLGQYLGGRRELRDLNAPEAPVYQTNQNVDAELARLQVLAQSGDPLIREQAMRDIATRQAMAEQAYRVGSGGDVSTFASGVAGANIAGMNAARQLAADDNERKMAYGNQLAGLIGQQTQDKQFKQQSDYQNFANDYQEFVRQGNRAAGQMNAGMSNIATGVQDLTLGGANFAGKNAAMQKILADFDTMTPEQQADMVRRYPKLFKMPVAPVAPPKPDRRPQRIGMGSTGFRVIPSAIAASGLPLNDLLTNFTIPK